MFFTLLSIIALGQTTGSLSDAARMSLTSDVTCVLKGETEIESLQFPVSKSVVHIIGTPGAKVRFPRRWNGDWTNIPAGANGIEFNCRQVIIRQVEFAAYEWLGSMLKFHNAEFVMIDNCKFSNSVRSMYLPKENPPKDANSIWLSQIIGGFGEVIIVSRCEFTDCAISDPAWNHCVYVQTSKSLVIQSNTFQRCGSSISSLAAATSSFNVLDNRVLDPVPGPWKTGPLAVAPEYVPAYGRQVWLSNVFTGVRSALYWGTYDATRQFWIGNDYSKLLNTASQPFATESGVGDHNIDWWKSKGFE